MLHHTHDEECLDCKDKLSQAHPYFVMIWPIVKKQFPGVHISWSYRGKEDQDRFFNEGKTKVKFPKSAHNELPSRALDLFELIGQQASFERKYYQEIYEFLESLDLSVEWSGTWKTFKESNHFQLMPEVE